MDFSERLRRFIKRATHASPMAVVLSIAGCILAVGLVGRFIAGGGFHRERGYPQFIIDRKENKGPAKKGAVAVVSSEQPLFDGEMYRTSLRVQESLDLAICGVLYVGSGLNQDGQEVTPEAFVGRLPKTAGALISEIQSKGLLPPGVTASNEKLTSEMSTLAVRYRVDPFGIEVVSVPRIEGTGPALIVRLSDSAETEQLQYYESMQLKGVTILEPFAPASKIIGQGWMPREFKGQMVSSTDYTSARELMKRELAGARGR